MPNELAAHIEHADRPIAHEKLDEVLDIIEQERSPRFGIRRLHCASVTQVCLRGALAGSAPAEALLDQFCRFLEELADVRSWPRLRQSMHDYVDQLVDLVRVEHRTRVESFVQWMLGDMEKSLHDPKRLADYAQLSQLSAGYLSRRFQEIVGLSYRQQLRQMRVKRTAELLRSGSLKILAITRQVGLRDPSQLIAEFRDEVGTTPAAYRNNAQRMDGLSAKSERRR